MKPTSASDRLEAALGRIDDPKGEGTRACLTVYRDQAKAAADAADARAKAGVSLGPVDGTIVSIKDLFDVAGEVTRVGSKVFAEEGKPAAADAPVVRRLRAGAEINVAKTNMSEFEYTGIGANPQFGTPGNPADRKRVPGGSTSGAAVAAADGMCEIAIGTDTGGSCRIPGAPGSSVTSRAGNAFRRMVHFRCRTSLTRSDRLLVRSRRARAPMQSWPTKRTCRSSRYRSPDCELVSRKATRWRIWMRPWT